MGVQTLGVQKLGVQENCLFLFGQEEGRWEVTELSGVLLLAPPFMPSCIHLGHAFQFPIICVVCGQNSWADSEGHGVLVP